MNAPVGLRSNVRRGRMEFGGDGCRVTRYEAENGDILLVMEFDDGTIGWADIANRERPLPRTRTGRVRRKDRP